MRGKQDTAISAEETTGENSRFRHQTRGCTTVDHPRFQSQGDGLSHGTGQGKIDHRPNAALHIGIGAQGLERRDWLVMQNVARAAGGLVRQKRQENRRADDGEPELRASPHLAQ